MTNYNDPVQELITDIGQIKEEILWIDKQIARQMYIQEEADNEMARLEHRKEVMQVDLFDLSADLEQVLSDQAGC